MNLVFEPMESSLYNLTTEEQFKLNHHDIFCYHFMHQGLIDLACLGNLRVTPFCDGYLIQADQSEAYSNYFDFACSAILFSEANDLPIIPGITSITTVAYTSVVNLECKQSSEGIQFQAFTSKYFEKIPEKFQQLAKNLFKFIADIHFNYQLKSGPRLVQTTVLLTHRFLECLNQLGSLSKSEDLFDHESWIWKSFRMNDYKQDAIRRALGSITWPANFTYTDLENLAFKAYYNPEPSIGQVCWDIMEYLRFVSVLVLDYLLETHSDKVIYDLLIECSDNNPLAKEALYWPLSKLWIAYPHHLRQKFYEPYTKLF